MLNQEDYGFVRGYTDDCPDYNGIECVLSLGGGHILDEHGLEREGQICLGFSRSMPVSHRALSIWGLGIRHN